MTMAQGDYLPGTYSRVGTEENPGTYLGGDSGGTSPTFQKLSAPYLSTRRF